MDESIKNNVGQVRLAFDLGMFDLSTSLRRTENSFMEALDFDDISRLDFQKNILLRACNCLKIYLALGLPPL